MLHNMADKGKFAVDEPVCELRDCQRCLERSCSANQYDFVQETAQLLSVGGYRFSNMHVFGHPICGLRA